MKFLELIVLIWKWSIKLRFIFIVFIYIIMIDVIMRMDDVFWMCICKFLVFENKIISMVSWLVLKLLI